MGFRPVSTAAVDYIADEATLVAYNFQTNGVGCCNYMTNLSKGFFT